MTSDIRARKEDHVAIVLAGGGTARGVSTGLEQVVFAHVAMPEMHFDEVSLATSFLGKSLRAPLLMSSMTGGHAHAAAINRHLAEAAEMHGVALAVGSQRVALDADGSEGLGAELRKVAPSIPIYANFGAAQLALGYGLDHARRAIDMIAADALFIHLNPLQEIVQPGGDPDWRDLYRRIEALATALPIPLMIKEVGFGISADVARRLVDCGVAAIDVAGAGGTNWALVEGRRATDPRTGALAEAFAGWGIPTAAAIAEVRAACPAVALIGSGGIQDGVEAAKAIRLGADMVGIAAGLLAAATQSTAAVDNRLGIIIEQLKIACFCTGSRTLIDLRRAALQPPPAAYQAT